MEVYGMIMVFEGSRLWLMKVPDYGVGAMRK